MKNEKKYMALPPLAQIAKEVGDQVEAMQDRVVKGHRWKTKPDGSPVSDGDMFAHHAIISKLQQQFPDIPALSEEHTPDEQKRVVHSAERFEVDPVDNTTGYVKNEDTYSINIARIKEGVPVEGAVYFPGLKQLYYTNKGKAYLQDGDNPPKPIKVRFKGLRPKQYDIAVGYNNQDVWEGLKTPYNVHKHYAQMRTCKVAAGECDMTGTNHTNHGCFQSYDIAGAHAVLLAAGGDIVDAKKGTPIRYNTGTTELPDHVAGGVETLIHTGLLDKEMAFEGRSGFSLG